MRLGLDFDNTLISYDRLFHHLAVEKSLVPQGVPPHKNDVRDYLRRQDKEDDWTRLQGEVYGSRILEAEPYAGVIEALKILSLKNLPMCIVSHKTRTPFIGEPWDLHAAARSWLHKHGFYDATVLALGEDQVYFELTKEEKVARILACGCTHYVDDLPEILEMLPASVHKILFSPHSTSIECPDWTVMTAWPQLPTLLHLQ